MNSINTTVLLAQLINFALLFGTFYFFFAQDFWKKLLKRRQDIQKLAEAQLVYDEMIARAQTKKDNILLQAKNEAKLLAKEMDEIAHKKMQDMITDAEYRAKMIVANAHKSAKNEQKEMLVEIEQYIVDMTLKLSKKIFKSKKLERDFVLKEMQSLS